MKATTSITVRVPLAIRQRGGRKLVVMPDGVPGAAQPQADPALVKALSRAHRWKRLLEDGRYGSLGELATVEKIDRSYLGKMLRLTLLAPDIIEAILNGISPVGLQHATLSTNFPRDWDEQRTATVNDFSVEQTIIQHSLEKR